MPSIGLYSANVSTLLITLDSGKSKASARSCIPSRSFGKNSCKGRSNNLIQTGRPFIRVNNSKKSDLCMGNNLSSTALRSSLLWAKIISRIKVRRSASKNMCSVLQRPIPCALKFCAVFASLGVSAFALTFISPASSAHSNINLSESSNAASINFGVPSSTCPSVPSIVIKSPSLNVRPSEIEKALSLEFKLISETPTTHGSPIPRPITAA